ncbi:hypothetical protein DPX16_2180 [Anabarilius grahami]|uniref:Uncharacterized protein n=1 Tax=Anabarilius grahami TaxID=495550 RepID=A0A3N0YG49_ANAGA|nr:hypothetical protein DPX16_2180 [Anabarilius grahami]
MRSEAVSAEVNVNGTPDPPEDVSAQTVRASSWTPRAHTPHRHIHTCLYLPDAPRAPPQTPETPTQTNTPSVLMLLVSLDAEEFGV